MEACCAAFSACPLHKWCNVVASERLFVLHPHGELELHQGLGDGLLLGKVVLLMVLLVPDAVILVREWGSQCSLPHLFPSSSPSPNLKFSMRVENKQPL